MNFSFPIKKFNVMKSIKENNSKLQNQNINNNQTLPINENVSQDTQSNVPIYSTHSTQIHPKKQNFRTNLITKQINKYFFDAKTKGIKSKGGCGCGGRK